jgi:2-oxoglutarate ferredoxin oxidoreductase subunit alpha
MRVADMLPAIEVVGEESADLLVVGWGGTLGHLDTAVRDLQEKGASVSLAHFNYIHPLPSNTAAVFARYKKIVVCELNLGQFVSYLRDKMPEFKYHQFNKVQGLPFTIHELSDHFLKLMEE